MQKNEDSKEDCTFGIKMWEAYKKNAPHTSRHEEAVRGDMHNNNLTIDQEENTSGCAGPFGPANLRRSLARFARSAGTPGYLVHVVCMY
jgi:hypothetical protein